MDFFTSSVEDIDRLNSVRVIALTVFVPFMSHSDCTNGFQLALNEIEAAN